MHGPAQVADALSVDDPDLKDAAFPARGQVIRHEILYFTRSERVQIQCAINRKSDWLIHDPTLTLTRNFPSPQVVPKPDL